MKRSIMLRPGLFTALVVGVGLAAGACGDDDEEPAPMNNNMTNNNTGPTQNIVELATASGLSTLVSAATTAGLADALQGPGPLTVFAPTNAAFTALGDAVPTDAELLANVLLHHVVSGEQDSTAVTTMGPFTTLANTSLAVEVGTPILVGGSTLSSTLDVAATNGIVHVMDAVIVPPTIPQAVQATADLSSLLAAVQAASPSVNDTLDSAGPLTVFAPTNAAFAASGIDLGTVDQAVLDRVLTYHVVAGQNTSDELTDGQTITMASGDDLTVNVNGTAVTLTDAAGNMVNVTTANIRLLNGVVHIIDGVLDPDA